MLRGLPCRSAGLAISSGACSTAFSCCSPACGSGIDAAISSWATSGSASTRIKYAMQKLKRCKEMMQGTQDAKRQLKERNDLTTIY